MSGARLLHYSKAPVAFDPRRAYESAGYGKPLGFWVSVEGDDDWRSFCESDWPEALKGRLCHEVRLTPDARILRISTPGQMDDFQRRWVEPRAYPRDPAPRWSDLARDYQGIIIAPYQWDYRWADGFMWYYGWDCASGVIWDLSAIASVAPTTEAAREKVDA